MARIAVCELFTASPGPCSTRRPFLIKAFVIARLSRSIIDTCPGVPPGSMDAARRADGGVFYGRSFSTSAIR